MRQWWCARQHLKLSGGRWSSECCWHVSGNMLAVGNDVFRCHYVLLGQARAAASEQPLVALLMCLVPSETRRWKEERRKHFPSAANQARKAAEAQARADSGALDPARQQRMARLKEVLTLQVGMRACQP
jgi:hypothetical protein